MKLFYSLLVLIFLLPTFSNASRKPASYSAAELQRLWRPSSHNRQKLVTSNSIHFWAWAHNEANSQLAEYLEDEGIVLGDMHPGNVADYRKPTGSADLAVVDIDDGGQAPLILDIARYITYLEASDINPKIQDVFDQYKKGLNGKKSETPAFLQLILEVTGSQIEEQHEKWADKNSKNKLFKYEKLDLTDYESASAIQQKEMDALDKIVLRETGFTKIFDRAYKVNDSGSSAGMSRYWYLLGDEKPVRIMEAKELGKSAVEYFESQSGTESRVQDVVKVFTAKGFKELSVIKGANKYFWLRPRKFQELDVDDLTKPELKEYSLYLANWLGLAQSEQASGKKLAIKINGNPVEAKKKLEGFVRAYLAEVKRLQGEQ